MTTTSTRLTSPTASIGVGNRFNANWGMEFGLEVGQFRSSLGGYSSLKGGVWYRF